MHAKKPVFIALSLEPFPYKFPNFTKTIFIAGKIAPKMENVLEKKKIVLAKTMVSKRHTQKSTITNRPELMEMSWREGMGLLLE